MDGNSGEEDSSRLFLLLLLMAKVNLKPFYFPLRPYISFCSHSEISKQFQRLQKKHSTLSIASKA